MFPYLAYSASRDTESPFGDMKNIKLAGGREPHITKQLYSFMKG